MAMLLVENVMSAQIDEWHSVSAARSTDSAHLLAHALAALQFTLDWRANKRTNESRNQLTDDVPGELVQFAETDSLGSTGFLSSS